jgi:hypothetical protein
VSQRSGPNAHILSLKSKRRRGDVAADSIATSFNSIGVVKKKRRGKEEDNE